MCKAHAALFVCVLCALVASASPAMAQDRAAIIRDSYVTAFGRQAEPGEVTYWSGRTDWTTKEQLLQFHFQGMRTNGQLQDITVRNAYARAGITPPSDAMINYWKQDLAKYPQPVAGLANEIQIYTNRRASLISESYMSAFGRAATGDEIKYWQTRADWAGVGPLSEMHRGYIRNNDAAADEIVTNSFARALGRQANASERAHWKPIIKQGYLCSEIEAVHRDWFKKELQRIVSNPKVMANIKAAGLAINERGDLIKPNPGTPTTGGNIVAAGGGNMVSAGAGNIVAAGAGNVLVRAGTYLIGQDGSSLVGNNGNTLIGHDGSTLIGKGSAGFRQ